MIPPVLTVFPEDSITVVLVVVSALGGGGEGGREGGRGGTVLSPHLGGVVMKRESFIVHTLVLMVLYMCVKPHVCGTTEFRK